MKGIIAPAFAGLAKIGDTGAYVLPQKTNSTAESKRKLQRMILFSTVKNPSCAKS